MSPLFHVLVWLDWLLVPAIVVGIGALLLNLNQGQVSKHGDPLIDRMPWYGAPLAVVEALLIGRHFGNGGVTIALSVAVIVLSLAQVFAGSLGKWMLALVTGLLASLVLINQFRTLTPPFAVFLAVVMLTVMCWSIGFMHFAVRNKRFPTFVEKMQGRRQDAAVQEFVWAFGERVDKKLVKKGKVVEQGDGPDQRSQGPVIHVGCVETTATEMTKDRYADQLASMTHLPRDQVAIVRGESEADVDFQFNWVDTLANVADFEFRPHQSIVEPLAFGVDVAGRPVHINFIDEHWLVGGISGAGKTSIEHMVCAHTVSCPNARLALIDPFKGLGELAMWRPLAWLWGDEDDTARRALRFLVDLVKARSRAREQLESQAEGLGTWMPTREDPQIIVVLDEATALTKDKVMKDALFDLASRGRSAGISLFVCTQFPHFEIFPTTIRGNLNGQICMSVKTAKSGDMIMEGIGEKAVALKKGGYCYVDGEGIDGGPLKARSYRIAPGALRDFASMHKPAEMAIPLGPFMSGDPESGPVKGLVNDSRQDRTDRPDSDRAILQALADGPLSQAEISRRSGVSTSQVSDRVKVLAADELIAKSGTSWSVTDAGRAHLERQEVSA